MTGRENTDAIVLDHGGGDGFFGLPPGPALVRRWWSGLGGPMLWRRRFPGREDQVTAARKMVRLLLEDTLRASDAEWITAELAANTLLHSRSGLAGGFFLVEVLRGLHMARITVYDLGGGGAPAVQARKPGQDIGEHGHGLRGVRQLAARAGVRGDATIGHAVWAQLALNCGASARTA
ncbi:ATP-binding protein [Microbispora hainanensis]|uniref:ATP-binding protein n=1 Tax=Microbispora hainanensis TaxID=568844 RepID=UPI0033D75B5A